MRSSANSQSVLASVGLIVLVCSSLAVRRLDAIELPPPIFYLPLDDNTSAAVAGGNPMHALKQQQDSILSLADLQLQPGKVGKCLDVTNAPLVFQSAGNFQPLEGTFSFWLRPNFRGDDTSRNLQFFGVSGWGMLYKYTNQTYLTFTHYKADGMFTSYCATGSIGSWRPGEWHHVVLCWSRQNNSRAIYLDGVRAATATFSWEGTAGDQLNIGTGIDGPWHLRSAASAMDELAVWNRALTDAEVTELYQRGQKGTPVVVATSNTADRLVVASSDPVTPVPPDNTTKNPYQNGARQIIPFDGWWPFLPSAVRLHELPADGWGLTRVPGYWTGQGYYSAEGNWLSGTSTIDPNGTPVTDKWNGQPIADFPVGYHLRHFAAQSEWMSKRVFLQLDGLDGLAEVYLNDRRLGWLPAWESESFNISDDLRFDAENTLVIALHRQVDWQNTSVERRSGLYGSVALCVAPQAFVNDVVARPSVTTGQLQFSCDLWSPQAADAQLVFEVAELSAPEQVVQRLVHSFRLASHDESAATLSGQLQRVECSLPWSDAHLWTYDDPFRYQLRTTLVVGNNEVDSPAPLPFGCCEFERRGSEFFLNGKPTHLRGQQIDVGWDSADYTFNQQQWVNTLKPAGLNCFELGAPIFHHWYWDRPYRARLSDDLLKTADETGLLVLMLLPDARVLQQRLAEPVVSQLYRTRLDKHIRRFGNHPSVAMWFMHFNHASYPWYIAPTKIDGSYKPFDAAFQAKEQYAINAQHIAQTIDGRPLYHHAGGNFGDIFTLNCYIGPTAPLQEREEWPSRWAATRPFPLVAAEHGLLFPAYWFRNRVFPLDDVYRGEAVFDEVAAIYLGRDAYRQVSEEVFDRYEFHQGDSVTSHLRSLVENHTGYQQVKSHFAKHSLRAWRTYGVSGTIFNAEIWDFKNSQGEQLPFMDAMARYFGDTDLYVAGAEGNWESKDHSFLAGEYISKQVVLLNDLTRDVTCTLKWRLEDANGVSTTPVTIAAAIARAGKPTMYPFELQAPAVGERTSFNLVIEPVNQAGASFQADEFPLEVFPAADRPAIQSKVFVFDATGDTTRMLERAGIDAEPLAAQSDLCGKALVIVGRQSWNDAFLQLAEQLKLNEKIRQGLNLLVMEQTGGSPFGLQLTERSTRNTFIASPQHAFLAGLGAEDFINLRGVSDVIEAYPPAPPGTELKYPERFFKWSNRGVVATYVYTKPHYAPFVPVLESGFDLVESPLLQATMGAGQVVLCQVDVTPRYGTDPVSTQLVNNVLAALDEPGSLPSKACAYLGDSAREFLTQFGVVAEPFDMHQPEKCRLIIVGARESEPDEAEMNALNSAADQGATVLLLPDAPAFAGLSLEDRPDSFIFRFLATGDEPAGSYPLLQGVSDSDLYLKVKKTVRVIQPTEAWQVLTEPGILAVKPVGAGQWIACQLDPDEVGDRGRVKALRFWNLLLAKLEASRTAGNLSPQREVNVYETNPWEEMPRYINW